MITSLIIIRGNFMVSLVVVNYNDYNTTSNFIEKIQNYQCINHIVIVDNESPDGSYEKLLSLANNKVEVIRSGKNGGYGYGNNIGINYLYKKYGSDICIISNPDVEFEETTVLKLEKLLRQDEEIALAAPVMTNPQGNICLETAWQIPKGWQYVLLTCDFPFNKFTSSVYKSPEDLSLMKNLKVDAVAGSFLMIRIQDFMRVEGYDENIFLYGEENVLGIKLSRINKISMLVTSEKFIHRHSVSINKSIPSRKRQRSLIIQSRMYVLKEYYQFKAFELLIAKLLINVSGIIIIPINKIAAIKNKFICNL